MSLLNWNEEQVKLTSDTDNTKIQILHRVDADNEVRVMVEIGDQEGYIYLDTKQTSQLVASLSMLNATQKEQDRKAKEAFKKQEAFDKAIALLESNGYNVISGVKK